LGPGHVHGLPRARTPGRLTPAAELDGKGGDIRVAVADPGAGEERAGDALAHGHGPLGGVVVPAVGSEARTHVVGLVGPEAQRAEPRAQNDVARVG
jgi:hypothetical protein